MLADVITELEARGHRAVALPVSRLGQLREHYEDLVGTGQLDEHIGQDLLSGLSLKTPEAVPDTGSLIVIATRDAMVCCTFRWRGADVLVAVPPTYLHYRRESEEIVRALKDRLPAQCHVAPLLNAPHKLLAVGGGLARYGRNNISYIPGLGSFYRLTTVCTSLPCGDGEWAAPSMMPRCEDCRRCASACPTGAIPEDRFLLRGELCITYWSEKPGDVPFPEWLDPCWHDCLVGCMRCQLACPENEDVPGLRVSGPTFSEDETETLLRENRPGDLPRGLREKLEDWDLLVWLEVLPRNLRACLSGLSTAAPG